MPVNIVGKLHEMHLMWRCHETQPQAWSTAADESRRFGCGCMISTTHGKLGAIGVPHGTMGSMLLPAHCAAVLTTYCDGFLTSDMPGGK